MTKLLELPHLVNKNGMTNVQIWRGGIKARLYDQGPIFLQFCLESVFRQNLVGTAD